MEEGDKIVGFLAFDRSRMGHGRPLAPGMSDCQAIVGAPDLPISVPALLRSCRLASLEFDHFLAQSAAAGDIRGQVKPSAIVDLSDGYAAYMATRTRRSYFKTAARKGRKLERDFGAPRFSFGASPPDDLATLLRWKSEQYRRTGRRDRFAHRWIADLVEQVAAMDTPEARGVFCGLYLDDRLIAGEFSLASPDYFSSWLPSYDTEFARYSPGSIATLLVLQEASAAGITQVDLGKGDEQYKASYKTHDLALVDGYLRRRSLVGLVWGAQRAARTYPTEFVLGRPALRIAARRALTGVGRLRRGPARGLTDGRRL